MRQPGFVISLSHAVRGLYDVLSTQKNMQRHVAIALLPIVLGAILGCTLTEWCLLALTIGLVLCCEVINTSIEWVVDLASPDVHVLAGRAKDCAAGAVLLASIVAVVVGLLIFAPKLLVMAA